MVVPDVVTGMVLNATLLLCGYNSFKAIESTPDTPNPRPRASLAARCGGKCMCGSAVA